MARRTANTCGVLASLCALGCSSSSDATLPAHDASLEDSSASDTGVIDAGPPPRDVAFDKITLHRDFWCEGAASGDLDGDGHSDVIAGPHWYAGPDFTEQHALWPVTQPFDVRGYADCFFQWTRDQNADGALDALVAGFPGQAAFWLENPGIAATARDAAWLRHVIIDTVDTESPEYLDLVGDPEPELLFAHQGKLGYASARDGWLVHPLSDERGFVPFTHGLGAADINSDGRNDVLEATAWWEQPASLAGDPVWIRHEASFGSGGAQMFGYDIDGDGDTDVAATLSAHGFGLAWYEQQPGGVFVPHVIVSGETPAADAPVILHEPHALALADIDGDGLVDLVTGERHWGHVPEGMPDFAAPAHLYWFRLVRDAAGARFEPHLIDDDSGVGTQLTVGDVDGDERPDLTIANKKGAFVLVQR